MINVYLLGHGYLWERKGGVQDIRPIYPIRTYVEDDTLLDSDAIVSLIDHNQFPKSSRTTHPRECTTYPSASIKEHLLCSVRATHLDYEPAEKFSDLDPEFLKDVWFTFNDSMGSLIKLDDKTYLYQTEPGQLTRLSDIQKQIQLHFQTHGPAHIDPLDVTVHWAACRSRVTAATYDELMKQTTSVLAQPEGLVGEPLPAGGTMLDVGGKSVPEVGIVDAIKDALSGRVVDCSVSDAKKPYLVTVVALSAAGKASITNQATFFVALRANWGDVPIEYRWYAKQKVVFAADADVGAEGRLKPEAVKRIVDATRVP